MIADEYLLDYIDGLLTPLQEEELKQLLNEDTQLKTRYESLLIFNGKIAGWSLEKPSADFNKKVMENLQLKMTLDAHVFNYMQLISPLLLLVFIFIVLELKGVDANSMLKTIFNNGLSFFRFGMNGLFVLGTLLFALYFQDKERFKVW